MRIRDDLPWVEIGLGLLIAFVLGLSLLVGLGTSYVSGKCLSLGYPEGRILSDGRGYCIARINNSDVVVPLAEAKQR